MNIYSEQMRAQHESVKTFQLCMNEPIPRDCAHHRCC